MSEFYVMIDELRVDDELLEELVERLEELGMRDSCEDMYRKDIEEINNCRNGLEYDKKVVLNWIKTLE